MQQSSEDKSGSKADDDDIESPSNGGSFREDRGTTAGHVGGGHSSDTESFSRRINPRRPLARLRSLGKSVGRRISSLVPHNGTYHTSFRERAISPRATTSSGGGGSTSWNHNRSHNSSDPDDSDNIDNDDFSRDNHLSSKGRNDHPSTDHHQQHHRHNHRHSSSSSSPTSNSLPTSRHGSFPSLRPLFSPFSSASSLKARGSGSGTGRKKKPSPYWDHPEGSDHMGTVTGKKYSAVKLSQLYVVEEFVGRGQSGVISACRHRFSGSRFACKSLLKETMKSEGRMEEVQREIQVMSLLKGHPNVVSLEGVFEDKAGVHIVMELCTGGSLTEHVCSQGEYSEHAAARTMKVVVEVIQKCHSFGICHRDIKLSNFLLSDTSDNSTIKAIDFGSAVFCKPGEELTAMAGSPMYIAPEVLDERYGLACDIWSAGIMMYTLLAGHPPFDGDSVLQIFDRIRSADLDLDSPPWPLVSEEAKQLLRSLLNRDPALRPTPEEILAHPWITGSAARPDTLLAAETLPRMKKLSAMSRLRHLALLLTTRHLQQQQMAGLSSVFHSVDGDSSGALSPKELKQALKGVGAHMSDDDIRRIFEFADADGSGSIDFAEFVAATLVVRREEHAAAIRQAFEQMDANHAGAITLEEFARVCCDLNMGSYDDLLAIITDAASEELGAEKQGQMDYSTFLSLVLGDQSSSDHQGWLGCLL